MSKRLHSQPFRYLHVLKARRSKAQHGLDRLGKKRHWFQNGQTLDGHSLPGLTLCRELCHSVPDPMCASHITEYARPANIAGVPFGLSTNLRKHPLFVMLGLPTSVGLDTTKNSSIQPSSALPSQKATG